MTESDITSPSFAPGDPFPAALDGITIDDEQDGDDGGAFRFAMGDKVAVQARFGSYVFTKRSGKAVSGPMVPAVEAVEVAGLVFLVPRA